MKDQWIKQIRQKMADYKQPAPEVSWEAIDKAFAASKPHKLAPLGYWLKGIAAAVILLLVAGVSLRIMHRPEATPDQQTAMISNNSVLDNNHTTTVSKEQSLPELSENLVNEPQPILLAESSLPQSKTTKVSNTPVISELTVMTDNTEEPVSSETIADENPAYNNGEEQPVTTPRQTPPVHFSSEIQIPTRNHSRQHGGRLLAQAYMSNAMSGNRQTEYNRQTHYNDVIQVHDGPISSSDMNNPVYYDTIINAYDVMVNHNVHHYQPVKFGLSLRYQFDDRWSLESGLTYTLLISDITTNVNGIKSHSKQKLHYLGIPLNMGYQFWTDRKLGLYVSAGGTIDKLLNGSGWQFSLNGSAGADYSLGNRLSLYAEPGVGYYIPNNSNLSTIYKDHPWNFNLTLGLRFHL